MQAHTLFYSRIQVTENQPIISGGNMVESKTDGRKGFCDMRKHRGMGLNFGKKRKTVNIPLIKEVITWAVELAIVLVVAYVLVFFIGLRTSVVGSSMSPTFESGDEILVNRFIYKVAQPKTDDLVVFLPNGNEKSHYYVKRVVAVPGDTVQIKSGVLYVNGSEVTRVSGDESIDDPGLAKEEITVGEDEYFVLGDNVNNSEDSRYANIGNVKKQYMIGKAWFQISPFRKFGFL